ncbi:MAG: 50S ribosomal protein L6 [Candidatus Nitrosocaldaceae archaeon]|nr:MAG: 50S ribosomal protein L6 [Candidatus Nitrosocaldaceae archaeon]
MSTETIEVFELDIPDDVTVNYTDNKVEVSGPKGKLVKDISKIPAKLEIIDKKIRVIPYNNRKKMLAIANTLRSLIRNMIKGVTKGYRYKLKIIYSHFPITVKVKDDTVLIENFIGERAPRKAKIQGDCKVKVEGEDVIVEGISLEDVSQTAANIELATKIKNKDLRVFLDGIYIYEKEK